LTRLVLLMAVVAVAIAATPSVSAVPTQRDPPRVCEGLPICIPIGGPWVVVPGAAPRTGLATTVWQLSCPSTLGLVGGVDARPSKPWISVSFEGRIGSPINPGITTRSDVVFTAVSVGPPGQAASFLPVVGCIPAQGGPRQPTAVKAPTQVRPGAPITRRVRVIEVRSGRPVRGRLACTSGERLLSVETAIGLYTALPPTPTELRSVRVTRSVRAGTVVVTAVQRGLATDRAAQVQIHALCAGRFK
jgi:hypothetical protein